MPISTARHVVQPRPPVGSFQWCGWAANGTSSLVSGNCHAAARPSYLPSDPGHAGEDTEQDTEKFTEMKTRHRIFK